MVRKIIWTALAKQSRREILNYWKNKNSSSTYSKKLNQQFGEYVLHLSRFPNLGKNSGFNDIHYLIVDVYKIYYKVIANNILILLIWDGRRNPDELKRVLLNLQ